MAEQRKSPYPWILIAAGAVLIVIGLVWVAGNQQPAPEATLTPASAEQVTRVSLEEAKAAFDAKKAVFLDVRDLSSYAANHIPGAVLIPANELASRTRELDPKAWIITYCT